MKFAGKKDLGAERQRGRAAIDAVFLPRINEAMGPKFALYQLKAIYAKADIALNDGDDTSDILKRFGVIAYAVAAIESERQAAQARVDAATSAAEIDAIISSL